MAAIDTHSLEKTYANGVRGLAPLDLMVEEGEIFAILGPNGAGKTTTVRLLNGTLQPSGGGCHVWGFDAMDQKARALSATMSEEALMYDRMSFRDNLVFYGALYGISSSESTLRAQELALQFHLETRLGDGVGTFSTGMKKRANLARCLIHRPKVLFLDEPTSGLDPQASREVMEYIAQLAKQEGVTVFLCTHNLTQVESWCTRIGFIKNGSLVAVGTRQELLQPLLGPPRVLITASRKGQVVTEEHPVPEPDSINLLVHAAIKRGDFIQQITPVEPDMEAVYQHYIGGVQ